MTDKFLAKKSLGQNFLTNQHYIQKILQACHLNQEDTVLEIGPGKGALTKYLIEEARRVTCVEKDRRCVDYLNDNLPADNLKVINQDILQFKIDQLPQNLIVIGNLPYNISTPIIKTILDHKHCVSKFLFMVQLEYGDRLVAQPNTKAYGSLSCFVQYHARIKKLFTIPPSAFSPAPKIKSCFMEMTFPSTSREKAPLNEDHLFSVIQNAFSHRRKTAINSLEKTLNKTILIETFNELGWNLKQRAEDISLEDYIKLVNKLEKNGIFNDHSPSSFQP